MKKYIIESTAPWQIGIVVKRSQKSVWDIVLSEVTSLGLSSSALVTFIVGGPTGLMLALAFAGAGVFIRGEVKIRQGMYPLAQQHPNLDNLTRLLQEPDHVLIAVYRKNGKTHKVYVEETLKGRLPREGRKSARSFKIIMEEADEQAVLFLGEPF